MIIRKMQARNKTVQHYLRWVFSFRGRHGTGTVSRKIFSPRDRVPEFFSPRDSPPKLSPGIPRPANLSPGPSPRSRIFQFWVPVPVPNPGFSDFASRSRSQSRIFCGIPQIPAVPFVPLVPDFRSKLNLKIKLTTGLQRVFGATAPRSNLRWICAV